MKLKKIFAGMAASAMAMTMAMAASAEEIALTGTATARRDSGDVRINVYNPWSDDDIDHAVESMEVFDYATEINFTVKVAGSDRFPNFTKLYIMGDENIGDDDHKLWKKEDDVGLECEDVPVSGDGEYTLTLKSLDRSWIYAENNFLAVYTDISVKDWDAWMDANDGAEPSDLLSFVSIDVTYENAEGGESAGEESEAAEDSQAEEETGEESQAEETESTGEAESTAETESTADAESTPESTAASDTTTTGTNTNNNGGTANNTSTNTAANNTANPAASSDNKTAASNDNKPTGAAAGIALAGIAVAGAALIITRKHN